MSVRRRYRPGRRKIAGTGDRSQTENAIACPKRYTPLLNRRSRRSGTYAGFTAVLITHIAVLITHIAVLITHTPLLKEALTPRHPYVCEKCESAYHRVSYQLI